MAASEILVPDPPSIKQIRFFITGSFNPADAATNWTIGTPTDIAITLAALAAAGARQSAKVDIGANRADSYNVFGAVDYTGETPTAGGTIDYYWAPSTSGTQATGNVAGNSGTDAACPTGALGTITLAEFLKWCQYIGALTVHDGAVVQNGPVGRFSPMSRYGQLIVVNNSDDAFEDDDVEMHTVFNPYVRESQ